METEKDAEWLFFGNIHLGVVIMGQIKAGAIEKGGFMFEKGAPFAVVEREFVNPGKGSAFVRLKLKNLRDGSVQRVTHKTQDNIEEIEVDDISCQYLYSDGTNYHFMENEHFEQFEVPVKGLEDKIFFMKEGDVYRLVRWGEETLDIRLPPKMDLVVTEAEEAVKGDTVTGTVKLVKLETGLEVKVPIFIKEGDKVRINVDTKEYQERINS